LNSAVRRSFIIFLLFLVFPGICQAEELYGKQASGYIGNLKERLAKSPYAAVILERRDYDSVNHARVDGLVFLDARAKYRYIRKLNDDHRLKINTAQGREGEPARPEESGKYSKLIEENKLDPHVLLDNDNREALVVYCGRRLKIFWSKEKSGEILLELRDPFKREDRESLLDRNIFGNIK
jgi:hypothetical protein